MDARSKLNGKTVLMVIPHTQFREEEFFEPKKLLEEEGAKVVVASTSVRNCYGMDGVGRVGNRDRRRQSGRLQRAGTLRGTSVPEFFWNDKKLHELTAAMSTAGKVVAAICLSTVVLAKAKLLSGRKATVYSCPRRFRN